MDTAPGDGAAPAAFPSTCWSRIVGAGGPAADPSRVAAYETLAVRYAEPIRAYVRVALRLSPDAAEDLAQDFFAWMLQTGFLAKADPARGRFRGFLKVALKNYAREATRKARAGIRGGGRAEVSLDADDAREPEDHAALRPEDALDRAWRTTLVEQALDRLRSECDEDGRPALYAVFHDYLVAEGTDVHHRDLARRHSISEVDVSNYLARAKTRFRAHLRHLVLDTVRGDEDLRSELRWIVGDAEPESHGSEA